MNDLQAPKLDTLPVGTLLINPADGTTYRRTGDLEWYDGDAANWRSSGLRGESGTVGNAEFRLMQIELDANRIQIAWTPAN